jgi:ribose 5-phosphate isomerase B
MTCNDLARDNKNFCIMSGGSSMNKETIWIGNDHGGYELKQHIIEYLGERNIPYKDVGSYSDEIVRYPHYASKVAGAISRGEASRGILICSTGIGMSIIANKYKGVRASLCTSTYMGRMTRAHNNSNLLCLGGKITGVLEALDILEAWLNTEFEGGRHCISLDMIEEAESKLCSSETWISEDPRV